MTVHTVSTTRTPTNEGAGLGGGEPVQGGRSVGRGRDSETFPFEEEGQGLGEGLLIFDDEDVRRIVHVHRV